jgi:hypothetical protein
MLVVVQRDPIDVVFRFCLKRFLALREAGAKPLALIHSTRADNAMPKRQIAFTL